MRYLLKALFLSPDHSYHKRERGGGEIETVTDRKTNERGEENLE